MTVRHKSILIRTSLLAEVARLVRDGEDEQRAWKLAMGTVERELAWLKAKEKR